MLLSPNTTRFDDIILHIPLLGSNENEGDQGVRGGVWHCGTVSSHVTAVQMLQKYFFYTCQKGELLGDMNMEAMQRLYPGKDMELRSLTSRGF